MILRLLWFAGVFGVSVFVGAHWDVRVAAPRPDATAILPFDPAAVITQPFHEIEQVLNRR
jgi:hypothetical protein